MHVRLVTELSMENDIYLEKGPTTNLIISLQPLIIKMIVLIMHIIMFVIIGINNNASMRKEMVCLSKFKLPYIFVMMLIATTTNLMSHVPLVSAQEGEPPPPPPPSDYPIIK